MRGVQLSHALLIGTDLRQANLSPMELRDREGKPTGETVASDLSDAKLIGANLSEANLTGANLLGASLEKVVARGTILEGAKLDPGANIVTTERRGQRRAR